MVTNKLRMLKIKLNDLEYTAINSTLYIFRMRVSQDFDLHSTLYIFRMRVSQDFDLQALISLCNRLEHAIAETDKRL